MLNTQGLRRFLTADIEGKGIRQAELARRLGIQQSTLGRILSEKTRTISDSVLEALCEHYGVTERFFYDMDPRTSGRKFEDGFHASLEPQILEIQSLLQAAKGNIKKVELHVDKLETILKQHSERKK